MRACDFGYGYIHVAGPKEDPKALTQAGRTGYWSYLRHEAELRAAAEYAILLEGPPLRIDMTWSWVWRFPAARYWHEITTHDDLARGQRVYLTPEGKTIYEPTIRPLTAG